jgi:hypothetical protein
LIARGVENPRCPVCNRLTGPGDLAELEEARNRYGMTLRERLAWAVAIPFVMLGVATLVRALF